MKIECFNLNIGEPCWNIDRYSLSPWLCVKWVLCMVWGHWEPRYFSLVLSKPVVRMRLQMRFEIGRERQKQNSFQMVLNGKFNSNGINGIYNWSSFAWLPVETLMNKYTLTWRTMLAHIYFFDISSWAFCLSLLLGTDYTNIWNWQGEKGKNKTVFKWYWI